MRLLSFGTKTWGVLALCGGAFVLANGCGSDPGKKATDGEEAGAAGAHEGGGPSSGGSVSTPGGAAGETSTGQAGTQAGGTGGTGGTGGDAAGGAAGATGEAGAAGQMAGGGAPSTNECLVGGSVTGLNLLTEAIYQGCRGSRVRVSFDITSSDNSFTCCGTTNSQPAYDASLTGESNQDGGGDLWFEVPANAPLGSYGMDVNCSDSADHSFSLEINDAAPPIVTGIPAFISPGDTVEITGENLADVASITAFRLRDATTAFCNIDAASQTATSVSCSFNSIPKSNDDSDFYVLEVANDTCGYALNRPQFIATQNTR